MNATIIDRAKLSTVQRSLHVDHMFGLYFPMQLEPTIFSVATELSPDYHGGYWDFYSLSNSGFFMAPDEASFRVACPNGFEGELSGEAFGVVVCLYSYSRLSFIATKPASTTYAEMYHRLRDYAMDHPEVEVILRATD